MAYLENEKTNNFVVEHHLTSEDILYYQNLLDTPSNDKEGTNLGTIFATNGDNVELQIHIEATEQGKQPQIRSQWIIDDEPVCDDGYEPENLIGTYQYAHEADNGEINQYTIILRA